MAQVASISQQIWDMKYRLKSADGHPVDKTVEDSWRRVAESLASVENDAVRNTWADAFYDAMADFKFLPAGRILSGAGTDRRVTLFNCFVMGDIPDDMAGIFDALKEAALTMQQGGGVGYDFSTLRPKGAEVKRVGADASGPLSFMDVWDAMCRTIMSAGSRRGAMMGTMRCDHPDVEAFIEAKREAAKLRMFNLSVLITDAFMEAVRNDAAWELKFDGTTYKSLPARELWDKIMRSTYSFAEPGVIFIDRINQRNNLRYCETIHATNPCGEQPLPPYGACLLGSVNLARLVADPFEAGAILDVKQLDKLVRVAVRMMDNVVDVSNFPLEAQAREARAKRRIGLGITGLADALIMVGVRYGSDEAAALTETWLKAVRRSAYLASVDLAKEKGAFPLYDKDAYLAGETIGELDEDVRDAIASHGVRNALLTSIAPTGTISLYADNVSSGLEPVFSFEYTRNVLQPDGSAREETVSDYAYRLFKRLKGEGAKLPGAFVSALELSPRDHLVMQAAAQKYVDSAISKTVNVPESISFADFKDVYVQAYEMGCKGCATYRPNDVTGAVLVAKPEETETEAATPAPASGETPKAEQQMLPLEAPAKQARPLDAGDSGAVVQMFKPFERPGELDGKTYKLRWPESEHALYITINDMIDDRGNIKPIEIFINSKDTEHFAWTVALTRMISAVFRRAGDVTFVVEELKAVFDPRGGHWMGGKYVPSLLAAIGGVVEKHLIEIGYVKGREDPEPDAVALPRAVNMDEPGGAPSPFRQCPKCSQPALMRQEGCDTCASCGYSRCG